MIVPAPSELRPCPVCGNPAELHSMAYDNFNPAEYVVFCQDSHCAGNQSPASSTAEEAVAIWNDLACKPYRWHKNSCPNCGWREGDSLEYPEEIEETPLPLWRNILRRIASGPVTFADCWYFISFLALFSAFIKTFSIYGVAAEFSFIKQVFVASSFVFPVVFLRFTYRLYTDWRDLRAYNNAFRPSATESH